jgi:hypothetical protein
MITPTLVALRDRLSDVESRLAVARRAGRHPAVVAALSADAEALRGQIVQHTRRRFAGAAS